MRRANYWGILFYNGVILGIWPSGALALIGGVTFHTRGGVVTGFVLGMCVSVPFFMWLYHKVIVPRRARRQAIRR